MTSTLANYATEAGYTATLRIAPECAWKTIGKTMLVKKKLSTPDQDSNLNLPVICCLVHYESSTLDRVTTEVIRGQHLGKLPLDSPLVILHGILGTILEQLGNVPAFAWRDSEKHFGNTPLVYRTEIRTSISPSSEVYSAARVALLTSLYCFINKLGVPVITVQTPHEETTTSENYHNGASMKIIKRSGEPEDSFKLVGVESGVIFKVHSTKIRTSISPSSAVELNTTDALANYATEAVVLDAVVSLLGSSCIRLRPFFFDSCQFFVTLFERRPGDGSANHFSGVVLFAG
uniref:Uncharacterized protein n=1 Tax=Timema monikensis TaxID=170555 RepID=A0A7R9DZ12_9NEOP|nr:unnamed protein product [Timema monikensis]